MPLKSKIENFPSFMLLGLMLPLLSHRHADSVAQLIELRSAHVKWQLSIYFVLVFIARLVHNPFSITNCLFAKFPLPSTSCYRRRAILRRLHLQLAALLGYN